MLYKTIGKERINLFFAVVYFYFAICFSILFFTIGFILYQKYDMRRQNKLKQQFIMMISEKQNLLLEEQYFDRQHIEVLKNQLVNLNKLISFEKALAHFEENEQLPIYLSQLEPVIKSLVIEYQQKDQMEQAYLAKFIATYAAKGKWHHPFIYKTLVAYLENATIYLRENILLATYQQPDSKWIISVFRYLTDNQLFHHPKLIQDGLLNYPYDYDSLIDELWEKRDTFHQPIVLGLIGYITYKSDRYKEVFYQLLQENQLDLEEKIRLIRYFRRHYYEKAESLLLDLANDKQDEIRIVAVNALSKYHSERVISTLKRALTDSNFYVRRNASQSLLEMGVSESELLDVLHGHDRYAKEMLRYHLQLEGRIFK